MITLTWLHSPSALFVIVWIFSIPEFPSQSLKKV